MVPRSMLGRQVCRTFAPVQGVRYFSRVLVFNTAVPKLVRQVIMALMFELSHSRA